MALKTPQVCGMTGRDDGLAEVCGEALPKYDALTCQAGEVRGGSGC